MRNHHLPISSLRKMHAMDQGSSEQKAIHLERQISSETVPSCIAHQFLSHSNRTSGLEYPRGGNLGGQDPGGRYPGPKCTNFIMIFGCIADTISTADSADGNPRNQLTPERKNHLILAARLKTCTAYAPNTRTHPHQHTRIPLTL